ncbi:hypothetical protein C5B95_07220 [Rathayibacter sp. AY1A7]|nr:hypothetical protein C5B95_07220 [Rathayibacter sp. AY1A7]
MTVQPRRYREADPNLLLEQRLQYAMSRKQPVVRLLENRRVGFKSRIEHSAQVRQLGRVKRKV